MRINYNFSESGTYHDAHRMPCGTVMVTLILDSGQRQSFPLSRLTSRDPETRRFIIRLGESTK